MDTSSRCFPVCTSWFLSIRPFPAGDCLPSLSVVTCCAIHTRSPLSSTEPYTACTTSRATVVGSAHPVNVVYVVVLLIIRYGGYRYPCRPLYKPTHCGLRCQRKDSWSGILPVSLWTIHISTEHRLRVLPKISLLRERCHHPFVSLARSPPPIVPSFLFFLILICFFEVYPRRGLMRLSITLRSLVPRTRMIHGPARFQDRPSSAQSCVATRRPNILAGTALHLMIPTLSATYIHTGLRRKCMVRRPSRCLSFVVIILQAFLAVQLCTGIVDGDYTQSRYYIHSYIMGLPLRALADDILLIRHRVRTG